MTSPAAGFERLPCGCLIGTVEDSFVMQPCSPTCEYYLYAVAETRRQGKPVEAIVDPAASPDALRAYGFQP